MVELIEGAWPAVDEQDWDGVLGLFGLGVNEVDREVLDLGEVLRKGVDAILGLRPTIVVSPGVKESIGPFVRRTCSTC